MTQRNQDRARRGVRRQHRKTLLFLWAALGLLLIGAYIALIEEAPVGGLLLNGVAAADGGSTIPIPPPKRPTPQNLTPTPTQTTTGANGPVTLNLSDLHLSPVSRVESTDGAVIPLTGSAILIENDSSGGQWVVLPFALTAGQEVLALQDPESGLAWQPSPSGAKDGGALTIPLAGGRLLGNLTLEMGPITGEGQEARSPILGAALDVDSVGIEREGSPGGTIRLSAELHRLPPSIWLDVQAIDPDSGMISALTEAARALNMGVAAIAYTVEIKTDLADEIASAIVEMAVEEEWAAAWTGESIRIVRLSADGQGSILETTYVGKNALGQTSFRAESPEGFSTFALIALGELTVGKSSSGSSWTLRLGIGLGVVALLGLGTGAYLLIALLKKGR